MNKGENKTFGSEGKHLVVICIEVSPLLLSHSIMLFPDRLTKLQEVSTARKNKTTGKFGSRGWEGGGGDERG